MGGKLDGKIALVGGSTSGIGRAIALHFARNGADVVVNGRNSQAGHEVVKGIEGSGKRALFQQADLKSYDQVKEMVDDVVNKWGKIDIVVANGAAEYPLPLFFHDTDPELYPQYIKSYMFTRLYMIRAALEHMKEQQAGKIIMTTTDAGRVPTPGESLIGAAAAGITMLTKVLAREFTRWKIHVNTISITVTIDTPAYERTINMEGSLGNIFRKAVDNVPFWPITVNDIAELALFLASNDSDRITGQLFTISGGLTFPG